MFKPNKPTSYLDLSQAGKNARQVQIRECFPQPLKERLDEGREMRRGKEKAFGDRYFLSFSSKTKKAEDGLRCVLSEGNTLFRPRGGMIVGPSPRWPIGITAFGLCLPFLIKNSGSARESAGNNRKEGVHVAAALAPLLVNGARALFSLRIPRSLSIDQRRIQNLWGPIYSISRAPKKTPSPSDSISLLTLYMWAPDIYEGSPTPATTFLSIAPKISISANISRLSIYGSYGATLQQIFFFCSIASMILGALAAMAQTKVKRLLAHSSIGHVGYIRTGFSCGTIEGIQSLLIGIFIYASMTIDAFTIVSALRQSRVKDIADLGALAKTNPISAITFSITMFSYAGIPPLAGFCSKFYLFFAALGCGAYFLALVGVVTSVIGRWAAGRLPRVSQFGGPKAVLRGPDT
uniref:NADH:quinone oxidoreductase/Mrp antiporter transmembrane domain-containing protein n=2 Tax=Lactuca sativa TaxID=4236 RepID=A0A9R1X598_LACSA|nr:hypothetical protein LSAT_V11C600323920 [Lactuca sativa]